MSCHSLLTCRVSAERSAVNLMGIPLCVICCFYLAAFNILSFFKYLFIYLFLVVLGLRCCAQAFSSCSERGLLFVVVRGLLIEVASLVAEHGL